MVLSGIPRSVSHLLKFSIAVTGCDELDNTQSTAPIGHYPQIQDFQTIGTLDIIKE